MIDVIMMEHHWSPAVIGGLFLDNKDYEGLIYIYDQITEKYPDMKKYSKEKDEKTPEEIIEVTCL
jgi:hypothetical protein